MIVKLSQKNALLVKAKRAFFVVIVWTEKLTYVCFKTKVPR
jgi:hypothetical protein